LGHELWQGIQLAFKQHKARTPQISSLVEILEADDAGSPNQAVRASEDLLRKQRVHVLIGSVNNLLNQGVADAAIGMNRMAVLPFATQDQLIDRSKSLFSVSLTEQEQGKLIAQFVSQDLQRKKAIIITEKDNPYSQALANGFRQNFKAAGGEIVTELSYQIDDRQDTELLSKIPSDQIDIVFIPGFFLDVARLIKQVRPKIASSAIFIGGDGWDDPKIAQLLPVAANSYYFFTPFSLNASADEMRSFIGSYQKEYRTQPSAMAYFGFAAMDALLATYLKANSNRSEVLIRQLTRTQEITSLLGAFQVTTGGTIFRPSTMMVINSGKIGLHRAIDPKL